MSNPRQAETASTFDWEAASPRERDAWIAEHVFDFEWWRSSATGRRGLFPIGAVPEWFHERADMSETTCLDHPSHAPHYTTDLAADLSVLRVVREWDLRERNTFYRALSLILCNRQYDRDDKIGMHAGLDVIDAYQVGDYSHAAYLARPAAPETGKGADSPAA